MTTRTIVTVSALLTVVAVLMADTSGAIILLAGVLWGGTIVLLAMPDESDEVSEVHDE